MAFQLPPVTYAGSVKNVRNLIGPNPVRTGTSAFDYTDHYSVFDWGRMPDELKNKGNALAVLTAYMFESVENQETWKNLKDSKVWDNIGDAEFRYRLKNSVVLQQLSEKGMPTHYKGINLDGEAVRLENIKEPTNVVWVRSANQLKPTSYEIDGRTFWDYTVFHDPKYENFLVPLECIFRFGVPKGSSLMKRVKLPGYVNSLGLKEVPKEGDWLPRPVVEFSTKHEPKDRYIGLTEAFNISGLNHETFSSLAEYNYLLAMHLMETFGKAGLELWDGKFEYTTEGLADAIGPDELRLIKDGVQVSKEPIRQYHKKFQPEWCKNVQLAETEGGKDWFTYCREVLKSEPNPMEPGFKQLAEHMYTALTNEVTGHKWFPDSMRLDEVVSGLKKYELD